MVETYTNQYPLVMFLNNFNLFFFFLIQEKHEET